jgi:DNA ligase D
VTDGQAVTASGHEVLITSPDRVYFPALGATKMELAEYYVSVGEALLRTAGGRPALLQRFPEGAEGKSFFQKRVPAGAPDWLQTTVVVTPNGTRSNALVVADLAHVLWAVNLGCLGLHLWPYLARDPSHADELRIDLDPQPGTGFDQVRQAARLTHSLLGELGITAYPKTTGNRGIHVYVRLQPCWNSTAVRSAAVALARELERRHPELVTAQWWKEERGARVFVDFNQNAPHKTVFGAWFARPRSTGQVSTPFGWDDLDTIDPEGMTIRTVPGRLQALGDPWASMADAPQSLAPLLDMAEADLAAGLPDAPWPPEYPKAPGELTRVSPSRARKQD